MTLTITCPICGERSGYEFKFGGEERGPRPDWQNSTPKEWCDYVHKRKNTGGIQQEWWYHKEGCGTWFAIYRDTLTNQEVLPQR
jgi:sarcosine oxidase subunit delta